MSYKSLPERLKTAGVLILFIVTVMYASSFGGIYSWGAILVSYGFVVLAAYELQYASLHKPLHDASIGMLVSKANFLIAILLPSTMLLIMRIDAVKFSEVAHVERLLPFVIYMSGLSLFAILVPVIFQTREDLSEIERKILERMISVLLVGLGGGSLVCLSALSDAPKLLLWTISMVAANDSAAYFIGAKIKTPALSPVLSPKKTVLGSAAGLIAGIITGYLLFFLLPPISKGWLFFSGVCCLNLIAQLGDLLSSLLKRLHGIKDLGTLLPGHGGVLDRIDGLLLASPFAVALVVICS